MTSHSVRFQRNPRTSFMGVNNTARGRFPHQSKGIFATMMTGQMTGSMLARLLAN